MDIKFINTREFSREAQSFLRLGYYCDAPSNTSVYKDYWDEQLKRCINGYSVGGAAITGKHYGYLNFAQIQRLDVSENKSKKRRKTLSFPDFWDTDYHYFWELEKARQDGQGVIVAKSRRKGFLQPNSEIIQVPEGTSTMGKIQPGDYVLTPAGKAAVLEKYEHGLKDVYEVSLLDGRKIKCGEEHLWEVWYKSTNSVYKKKVVQTKDMIGKLTRRINKNNKNIAYNFYLRQINPVSYSAKKLPIDPYLLGLLLGDGTMNRQVKIATADLELLSYIEEILGDKFTINKDDSCYNYRLCFKNNFDKEQQKKYGKGAGHIRINPLKEEIKLLGLDVKGGDKFIPDIYKYSSVEQRREILRGLLDTDGSISSEGAVDFSTKSRILIEDVAYIVRSLGINCTLKECKYTNGVYRLYIRTNENLFRLKRKVSRVREKHINTFTAITGIKNLGYQEESSCILIDDPDHLYLTTDFVVTHNSFKNAWIVADEYNTVPSSVCVIGAYLDAYADNTVGMVIEYLNFLNKHTAFRKQQNPGRREFIKAQFKERLLNGTETWSGYKSEIHKITFKDNPFNSIGRSTSLFLFEEAGKFKDLISTYRFSEPTWRDGDVITGMPVIFGTGGDVLGGTADFCEMFYNPGAYNLRAYSNIWDNGADLTKCGYFIPDYCSKVGHIDEDGNSDIQSAKDSEVRKREVIINNSKRRTDIDEYVSQNPFTPQEAFIMTKGNIFPVKLLQEHLAILETRREEKYKGEPGKLEWVEGEVVFKPDTKLKPVDFPIGKDIEGCVIVYEQPKLRGVDTPYGLYIMATDPYRFDKAEEGSLGGTIVWKQVNSLGETYDWPVATYYGRPETTKDYYENVRKLCYYFNAINLFENEIPDMKSYFDQKNSLHYLKMQPQIIKKIIPNSTVERGYGTHMSTAIRDHCEKLTKDWLIEEFEPGRYNLTKIKDKFLVKQLITYHRDGNFDAVDSLLLVMLHREENHKIHVDSYDKNNYLDPFFTKDLFARRGVSGARLIIPEMYND